jgi:hypothetical protein
MNGPHPRREGIGLQLPSSTWTTGASDAFIGETFQMITYGADEKHTNPIGPLIDDNGKTAELSPQALTNS